MIHAIIFKYELTDIFASIYLSVDTEIVGGIAVLRRFYFQHLLVC